MRLALGAGRAPARPSAPDRERRARGAGRLAGAGLAFSSAAACCRRSTRTRTPIELALGYSRWVLASRSACASSVGLGCGLLRRSARHRPTPGWRSAASSRGRAHAAGHGSSPADADRAPGGALAGAARRRRALHAHRCSTCGRRRSGSVPISCCWSGWTRRRPATRTGACSISTAGARARRGHARRRVGGVLAVGACLSGGATRDGIRVAGAPAGQDDVGVHVHFVSPGYFADDGDPLLAGRDVSAQDCETAPRVASSTRRWRGRSPAGRPAGRSPVRLRAPDRAGRDRRPRGDARFASLREPAPPTIYLRSGSIASTG